MKKKGIIGLIKRVTSKPESVTHINETTPRKGPPIQPEEWEVVFYPVDKRLADQKRLQPSNRFQTHYPSDGRIPNTAPKTLHYLDGADPDDRQRVMKHIQDKAFQMAEYNGVPYTWDIKVSKCSPALLAGRRESANVQESKRIGSGN